MTRLMWGCVAVLALVGGALAVRRPPRPTVHLGPSPVSSAALKARCPRHTLEDDGVCIPTPHTAYKNATAPVGAYPLPVTGTGFFVNADQAPLPDELNARVAPGALALLVRTEPGREVVCRTALRDAVVVERGASSVVVRGQLAHPDLDGGVPTAQLAIAGLRDVSPELSIGSACTTATVLGHSRDAVVLFAPVTPDTQTANASLESLLEPSASTP